MDSRDRVCFSLSVTKLLPSSPQTPRREERSREVSCFIHGVSVKHGFISLFHRVVGLMVTCDGLSRGSGRARSFRGTSAEQSDVVRFH